MASRAWTAVFPHLGNEQMHIMERSKEELMYDGKEWSWGGRIQERGRRSIRCRLRWLVLPLLGALASIPAAAQCTAYVPTHKSNSVAVIDTVLDRVVTTIPVQIQPLAVAITPN